jgi:hypothetical protein
VTLSCAREGHTTGRGTCQTQMNNLKSGLSNRSRTRTINAMKRMKLMSNYKVKDNKRGWLESTGAEHYIVEVETFNGYGKSVDTTFVDADLTISDGNAKVYLAFSHERGNRRSIRAARAKYEKLSSALEVIESHLRDAEDNCEMEAAAKKEKAPEWEA